MEEIKLSTKFVNGAGLTNTIKDFFIMEGMKEIVGSAPNIFFECGDAYWCTLSDDHTWGLEYQDRKDIFYENNKDSYYLGTPIWR